MSKSQFSRRRVLAAVALAPVLIAYGPSSARTVPMLTLEATLLRWIEAQRSKSIGYLLRNISPTKTFERSVEARHIAADRLDAAHREAAKPGSLLRFEGERFIQSIVPKRGAVLAADRGTPDEPDYAFHWIRDSSLIMREMATLVGTRPRQHGEDFRQRCVDYVRFSRALQQAEAAAGPGEVRYNLDGTPDYLQWSRPQHDGPPLRALALLQYRSMHLVGVNSDEGRLLDAAIGKDLDDVAASWDAQGFDLWEEYRGHDFHARVTQVGALRAGARWAREVGDKERALLYAATETKLRGVLEEHWLPAKGYYGLHAGHMVYWDGKERVKPGENFDAAVVTAAVHSRLSEGRYSLLDDRILASMDKAEELFSKIYAFNVQRGTTAGLLYGRYQGDTYFGGNPFVFITLEFAEAYYRIGQLVTQQKSFAVTPQNRAFLGGVLRRAGLADLADSVRDVMANRVTRRALVHGLVLRGDDILRTVQRLSPESGELPEQFNQNDGAVASSKNVSWSHAALLSATRARAEVVGRA